MLYLEASGVSAVTSNGRLASSASMDKKPPQTLEMKAFLAYLEGKMPPQKSLEIRASITAAHMIARLQRQSRLKK